MFSSRFDSLPPSPFPRLADLVDGIEPGAEPVNLSIGEPGHPIPDFVRDILAQQNADFSRYPPAQGTESLRMAISSWIGRRYGVGDYIDPARNVIPVCGSREALFSIALVAVAEVREGPRPLALMPNPFYQTYATAAVAAGAEPYMLAATPETGHLPDLDAIPEDVLSRTAIFYLCTPANPQGAVATRAYLEEAIGLARAYGFTLVSDECYSEVYDDVPPPGAIEAAHALGEGLSNLIVLNSLSKRSNLAGLRSGFCAGDGEIMASFVKFRNLSAPQLAFPIQSASEVVWGDEDHVKASRALYREKYAIARDCLGRYPGFEAPRAGMFLWLDVAGAGGSIEATKTLWKECGLRVLPGAFLSAPMPDGSLPGENHIRIALVRDAKTTRMALSRIAEALG